jgi:hypothetical protein
MEDERMKIGDRVVVKRNPKLRGTIVRISDSGGYVVSMDDGLFNSTFDANEIERSK